MDWTLADIKTKVRAMTGRPSSGQLTDADLENAINQHYRNMLPYEAHLPELVAWFSLDTAATDTGEYGLAPAILTVRPPITAQDADGTVTGLFCHQDPPAFFALWQGITRRGRPTDVLCHGRALYVRPLPDAVYTLGFSGLRRPDALSGGTSRPLDVKWGPAIAYGAAMEILQEAGEDDEVDRLKDLYHYHIVSISRRAALVHPPDRRATPRF